MPPERTLGSRKIAGFGTTIFSEMTQLANEHGAVNLAQGFPDFDGPGFATEAALAALVGGHSQYARSAGAPSLAAAVAASYERHYGLHFAADDEVTVGCGATELVFAAVQAFCDVGDEVVLFEPFYDSYRASVALAGASARVVALHPPHWRLDAVALERAFTPRTRLVVVNTPHNPTGKVFSPDELDAIAALCRARDVVCVSDEVYEHFVYEGRHVPMASRPGMRERTVTVSSASKTFSVTGWRVGWAVAPPALTAALRAAHQFITFAAPTPLQHAAAAALAAPSSYFDGVRDEFRRRRDTLARALAGAGLDVYPAPAAYFLCAGIGPYAPLDDVAFCRFLTRDVGVAAVPPSAFYEHPELGAGYARFVFCKRDETIAAAAERLARLPAAFAARAH